MVSSRTSGTNGDDGHATTVNATPTSPAAPAAGTIPSASSNEAASRVGVGVVGGGYHRHVGGVAVGEDCVANGRRGASEWSQSGPPSLSMSVDLHNLVTSSANLQDSGHFSSSPERPATAAAGPVHQHHHHHHDEEESYEAFGSVDAEPDDGIESHAGSSSTPSPTGGPNSLSRNPRSPNSTIGRQTWLRTSLRRSQPGSSRKRLSSNALASQLYRSGSFNSLGRSVNCETTDDLYSDVSLEDDFIDLNQKVQMIQEQMDALVDTQSVGEERYARVKQENATLQARILMLEEAAKDAETRAEERLQAEQRRYRELASRLEREKQLQLENCAIKMQANEMEKSTLRDEVARLREQLEKVRTEKSRLENDLAETKKERDDSREGERQATSRANATLQMLEVAKDELAAALEDQQRYEELAQDVAELRARNKILEESRDELQAALALQAGRELLMKNTSNNTEKGPSLAAELLAGMNQDQADSGGLSEDSGPVSISELKQALKEQQEVNAQLRTYIDGILLNIVENYPQLLEVKQAH